MDEVPVACTAYVRGANNGSGFEGFTAPAVLPGVWVCDFEAAAVEVVNVIHHGASEVIGADGIDDDIDVEKIGLVITVAMFIKDHTVLESGTPTGLDEKPQRLAGVFGFFALDGFHLIGCCLGEMHNRQLLALVFLGSVCDLRIRTRIAVEVFVLCTRHTGHCIREPDGCQTGGATIVACRAGERGHGERRAGMDQEGGEGEEVAMNLERFSMRASRLFWREGRNSVSWR